MKVMVVITFILTSVCLVLGYLWIDRSITLAYSKQSAKSASDALRRVELVLAREWKGLPEAEVLKRLQATYPQGVGAEVVVKQEGSVIWLDDVSFHIEDGRLKSIGSR
jgi:Immunity protein 58